MRNAESESKTWPQTLLLAVIRRYQSDRTQHGLSPCSWFLGTSHSFSHPCPFPACGKTWQLAQPHLIGLKKGWDSLQVFLGDEMDLPAAIFIDYSGFTGDSCMSGSLAPREDCVLRSMAGEQTLLSQNTRPQIISTIYQTHCWLYPKPKTSALQ